MKIALFTIHNYLASHYVLFSYRETLERMGHTVLDCPFPGNQVQDVENVRNQMPRIEDLNKVDIVLNTFAEYTTPWLSMIYGFETWSKLKVPVIARFDESMDRADLGLPARVPELKRWAQYYSFPAAQDAEKYGGQWLPFGADTTIFKSGGHKFEAHIGGARCIWCNTAQESNIPICDPIPSRDGVSRPPWKKYDVGFIGTLYPGRRKYLDALVPHIGKDIIFRVGNAIVQDLSGIRERESTELLAENYRQCRIFFCLPPTSRLLVEKIFDVMACGTLVMYPRLLGDAKANMEIFKDQEHIVYYEPGYVVENAAQINDLLETSSKRETIARAGSELIRSKYTLEMMLNKMLQVIQP